LEKNKLKIKFISKRGKPRTGMVFPECTLHHAVLTSTSIIPKNRDRQLYHLMSRSTLTLRAFFHPSVSADVLSPHDFYVAVPIR